MTLHPSDIRFGTIALNKGFISSGQLGRAVSVQMREDLEKGVHRLLGEILLQMGFMKDMQVKEVLEEQGQ